MRSKQVSVWAILLLTMVLGAACGSPSYEPQAINEETDRCVICNMAIKDDEFATQIITKDGQSLKFDDIGCMNEWKTEYGTDTVGAEFVRDYTNSKWLKYEDAYYVYAADIQTPMAYGIVSFEQQAEAEAFMNEHGMGELMTASDLADHSWAVNREMMEMSGMEGHSHSHDGETDAHGDSHGEEHGHESESHGDSTNEASGNGGESHGDGGGADQSAHGHGANAGGDSADDGHGMTTDEAVANGTAA